MKKMKIMASVFALAILVPASASSAAPPPPGVQKAAVEQAMQTMLKEQKPQKGDVTVLGTKATLHLGDRYYFLNAADAKKVLIDAWGNPPDVTDNVLGMVFPAGKNFLDDTWGAVLTYEGTGYVSDGDAKSADYDDLMTDMQSADAEINERRKTQGYDEQHLIGWAERPTYDAAKHSVIWAQNIKFGSLADNSLNYDVRVLGRYGVLSVNLLSSMSRLPEIRMAAEDLSAAATFDPGARYADFDASTDTVAEYGVGGLVAAGVGVAVAKKLGLLGLILAFGKKFLILIFAAFATVGGWFRRKFGGNKEEAYDGYYEESESADEASAGSEKL
jgi:uncharacterized membrane-anchored protein